MTLCHPNPHQVSVVSNHFSVESISTRQQWLEVLTLKIKGLIEQKEAIILSLAERFSEQNITALNMHQELGEIEKRITVAQEIYNRAMI